MLRAANICMCAAYVCVLVTLGGSIGLTVGALESKWFDLLLLFAAAGGVHGLVALACAAIHCRREAP